VILLRRSAPLLELPFAGARGIPSAVEALIGPRGLGAAIRPATPKTLDLVGLAMMEVLHSIVECSGERRGGPAGSVALWTEPELAVIVVRFAGPPLPGWLVANWDRGEEPTSPEAPRGCGGWGWLLVREALDGVSAVRSGNRNLLFLERWL
jgi:hypothetical protein